jgi:hypothetical protein
MKVVRSNSDTRLFFEKNDVNIINYNLKKTRIRSKKSEVELILSKKHGMNKGPKS